jgi:16S rRNA (cytidine1402-2'-O)-methyltransferase
MPSRSGASVGGTLYVVGTPIGNLGDLTRRAEATLASVDVIAAEDTRRTRALLSHLGITGKSLVSLDANAGDRTVIDLVGRLAAGEMLAFVTDAGTPGVSDPGTKLVRAAIAEGIAVMTVPGPSAVTSAVAVSGLVEGPFLFLGFLPRRGEKRRRAIRRIRVSVEPVVLFEAPARIRETLEELSRAIPERQACVLRELTKLHEEALRGTLRELAKGDVMERGEFTVVVAGGSEEPEDDALDIEAVIKDRLRAGDSPRTVADDVASLSGKSRREIYARVLDAARRREEG